MASPFRKAKAEQAVIKMGFYGATGSGKTLTALLCAEGLAKLTGKRIAYIDTEPGTDFYIKENPERTVHPAAFDFDAVYTRRISEVLNAVRSLDPNVHSVLVIDSITHIWEAAILAYQGRTTSIGTIPFQAWAQIKKPYKEILNLAMSLPCHLFICGRQGNEFRKDEETGELEAIGKKMKAEGETAYEPHTLIHMEAIKPSLKRAGGGKYATAVITAYGEKDRTSMLAGKIIEWPNFDNLVAPILPLLGITQAAIETDAARSVADAEAFDAEDDVASRVSADQLRQYRGRFEAANTRDEVETIGQELTAQHKKLFTPGDLKACREYYLTAKDRTGALPAPSTSKAKPGPESVRPTGPPVNRPGEEALEHLGFGSEQAVDEKAVGKDSKAYKEAKAAFDKLKGPQREAMRKQLGIEMITDLQKYSEVEVRDATITILETIAAETPTQDAPV